MTDLKPSMLEIHDRAFEEVDEAYHQFLLIYRKNARCVYGFVEGKDDPVFYRHLIENQLPEGWSIKLIPTGGKQQVLRSFQSIDWIDFSKKRICFFLDRDLDDFLVSSQQVETNIYITDGYSIENSVLEYRVLSGVLSDVYRIRLLDPKEEELIKEIINNNMKSFFEAIMPLMGQILVWRRNGVKANLSNLKNFNGIFSFSGANFESKTRDVLLQKAAKQMGCQLCGENEIAAAEMEFRDRVNWWMMIRGKYVLWFYVKQCEALWEIIPQLLPRFKERPQKTIQYGLPNAMVIFGPRARSPESLKVFVQRNYLSFISEVNNSQI